MKTRRVLASLFLVLGAALGCSDDEETGSALGELCSGSIPCVEGARCDARGFCTKTCSAHADCGCAAGTTDSDIAASSCPMACVSSSCVKVCRSDAQCAGETTCLGGSSFDTCE